MRNHLPKSPDQRPRSPGSRKLSVLLGGGEEYQSWLQASAEDASSNEDELVSSSRHQECLVEPGFDTSDAAIFSEEYSESDREALKPIVWRRVTGMLIVPTLHYSKLVQGCLCRNAWLLGALAAVSTKQQLLLNLVASVEQQHRGLCTFQFFKHGAWRQVVVDNRLPCLEVQQRLAFASSATPQELWPSLVEKAYARLHGGYAAIASGCVADALVDLTGGVVDTISLSSGLVPEDTVWLHIMQTLSAGNIAVCMPKQHPGLDPMSSAACCAEGVAGLQANCPYSILAAKVLPSGRKLLRLHNPWAPAGVWQGSWGPDAPEWASEKGQAALEADPAMQEGLQDPSTFWCTFWDFTPVFSMLHLLQLPDSHLQQAMAFSGWGGALAADCFDVSQPLQLQEPQQQQQQEEDYSSLAGPGHTNPYSPQGTAQPGQLSGGLLQEAADKQQGTTQQRGHQQQQMRQQCQQVPAECMVWAGRPQLKLQTASTCEVVLCLQQCDTRLLRPQSPSASAQQPHQGQQWPPLLSSQLQQQPGLLQVGLRVCSAPHSPGLQSKVLAAAGLSRPGTSFIAPPSSPARCSTRGSSRSSSRPKSRSPSRSPPRFRPSTAPVPSSPTAAVAAADEAAASSMYRVWVPELQAAAADSGLCSSRDVLLRFVAEEGRSYVVLPYTRSAADTGPFILRAWAPCAVQLEQLPSPHSLRQGGRWLGSSAGGGRAHATWASNPQYLVTCARETTVLLCLQRPDVCNSLMPQPFEPQGCVNLTVCQLNTPAGAKVGTPAVMAANALAAAAAAAAGSKVVGSTHDCRMDRTVLLCKLLPGTPYVVVPSTAEPGVEVPFELLLLSSHPLELCELPRQCTVQHSGSWGDDTCGGSNLHSSWLHNPAYTLQLERKTLCRITLTRAAGSWRRNQPLGEMIGLSALRLPQHPGPTSASQQQQGQQAAQRSTHAQSAQRQQHKPPENSMTMLKQHQLQEAAFVPMEACEVEWELPGGVPLLLVPCTYAPGVKGAFTVSVSTSGCAFQCEAVPGGLAALLSATGTRVTRVTQHQGC